MSKIIVERPRFDHAGRRERPGRTRAVTDDDGEPLRAREPVAPRRKTKNLNENLAPLERYIASQIGRPWNKVFSDISANLRPSSTVQQHVRDHVEDFVAFRTRMKDGVVMTSSMRFGGERPITEDSRKFFVHPRSGLLKHNPHWRAWRRRFSARQETEVAERAKRMRVLDDKTQLHLLNDGAWWIVELEQYRMAYSATQAPQTPYVDVVSRAQLSDLPIAQRYGREGVYARAKRQMSKAEKKSYGLD